MAPPLFKRGDELGEGVSLNRWKIIRKVGEGQFAEVYEVADALKDNKRYALKVERSLEAKTVRAEAKVLRGLQASPHVVRLLEQGTANERSFIVMELLGMNVADARRSCAPGGRWGVPVMRHIGALMLDALAGMHKLGYIHRDVKPANFAITPRHATPAEGAWHVIDFGLARKFTTDDGSVIAARDKKEFRGSTSYASLAAHQLEDLGRRDDLWSWLYVLVELLDGTLPWRAEAGDRSLALSLKQNCLRHPEHLTSNVPMPGPLIEVSNYLSHLKFEDEPDYNFLHGCLERLTEGPPVFAATDAHPQVEGTSITAASALHAQNLGSAVAISIPRFTSAPLYMVAQQVAPLLQLSGLTHAYGALYEGLIAGIADTPSSPAKEATAAAPNGSHHAIQHISSMALPTPLTLPPPLGLPQMLCSDLLTTGATERPAPPGETSGRAGPAHKREADAGTAVESKRLRIAEDNRYAGRYTSGHGGGYSKGIARDRDSSSRLASRADSRDCRDSREGSAPRTEKRAAEERRDRQPAIRDSDRDRYRDIDRSRESEADRTHSTRERDSDRPRARDSHAAGPQHHRDVPASAASRLRIRAGEPAGQELTLHELVEAVAKGNLSSEGRECRYALSGLASNAEACGLLAYHCDRIVTKVSLDERMKVAEMLDQLRHYIAEQAERCWALVEPQMRRVPLDP